MPLGPTSARLSLGATSPTARPLAPARPVPEIPRILHAVAAGAGRRRHPALFVRREAAAPAACTVPFNAPRTIGLGDAPAQIDHGGRAKDDKRNSGANHGGPPFDAVAGVCGANWSRTAPLRIRCLSAFGCSPHCNQRCYFPTTPGI